MVRYIFFAYGALDPAVWMILVGIALHGICYDFFFVTGQIYVDLKSNEKIRGQAQGLIVIITYGIGLLIGAQLAGLTYNLFLGDQVSLTLGQWHQFWWVPALFAAVVMIFFMFTFNDEEAEKQVVEEDAGVF